MIPYIESLTKKARERGIKRLHFHIEDIQKRDLSIFGGAVEHTGASHETLVLVEGEYKGFIGSSYAEDWDEKGIPVLTENIIQTAEQNSIAYVEKPIFDMPVPDTAIIPFYLHNISEELLAAEKAAKAANSKLRTIRLDVSRHQKTVTLMDGEGRSMKDQSCFLSVMIDAMAKDGDKVQTAFTGRLFPAKPDFSSLAIDTASEACLMLTSKPCTSGNYSAVIANGAFAELFGAFLPAFYAEKCQGKMSFMAAKLGKTIASQAFSAYEDPFSLNCRRFDDEGTQTTGKFIIEKGQLCVYFHNTQTAAKDTAGNNAQKSNGNGFRQYYKENISSAYTNVYVEAGQRNLNELLFEMGDGLLITACDGIFAGVNPVSGDFSVISKGFMIRNGRLCEPVSGITIGGNLITMLAAVEETGNDTAVVQSNTGIVGSGSLRLSNIIVSGKSKAQNA